MKKKTIIIMAGGTCGHIFPGLEIAFYLIKQGWNILWLGTSNRIEAKIIPKYGIKIKFINIQNMRKKGFVNLIKIPFNIIKAYLEAKSIIKTINPNIILGMGSYISIPGALVAYFHKTPLLIHEQNRVPGLANKLLTKLSTVNMQAFPNTLSDAITVGNPIRRSISQLKHPKDRLKNRIGPLRILILGGSQGTEIFNKIIPHVANILKKK